MVAIRDAAVLARMSATLELYEAAEDMMRQQLKRLHPGESVSQIERRLLDWLQKPRED